MACAAAIEALGILFIESYAFPEPQKAASTLLIIILPGSATGWVTLGKSIHFSDHRGFDKMT